jgi:hypothetical protein
MGNLTVVVNYGDGSNESIYLGEDLSILLADGLRLNHSYIALASLFETNVTLLMSSQTYIS